MKIHPTTIILFSLLVTSINFNISYHMSNQRLIYKIQKLEAGPATGIFHQYKSAEPKPLSDEEINEKIKEMLREKAMQKLV